ncbi:hypothetical protein [Schinkia azotoformans]|uniref:hypothetical protein n=1 Tax=Schinkia azotoformans TaxID=1454 RepID=UPI002DB9DD08|nr:hypothetical protein [Schinkia azotoformans]MEC1780064.1 hypothetical protein [Schinkia azotoformans]MED4330857.1 hypothetical protein [Schinkia azotoformans]
MNNKNFDTTPIENFVNAFRDMVLSVYDKFYDIVSSEEFQSLLERQEQINQLIDVLRECAITRNLIPTYGEEYRGLGKTTALIEFAKEYGFSAIVHIGEDVEGLREVFEYDDIYTIKDLICDIIDNKKLVIDEGVNRFEIPKMYEVITGFENHKGKGIFLHDNCRVRFIQL